MLEQQLIKVSGVKLLGGTLLSIGGVSALVLGGVFAWKIWNRNEISIPVPETVSAKTTSQQTELQTEIDALHAEKQKLADEVNALKTQNSTPKPVTSPLVIEEHDDSFPDTNSKLGMLHQLVRENLDLRNAAN